jgi:hypothetical protein
METHVITLESLMTAPEHNSSRGRVKGSSKMEREFGTFYNSDESARTFSVTNSEYAALRLAVNRKNGSDSSKMDEYENALNSLGLIGKVLSRTGTGTDQIVVVGIGKIPADES